MIEIEFFVFNKYGWGFGGGGVGKVGSGTVSPPMGAFEGKAP